MCAVSGGGTGKVRGCTRQGSAKAGAFLCSLEDLQQIPESFGALAFPSVGQELRRQVCVCSRSHNTQFPSGNV